MLRTVWVDRSICTGCNVCVEMCPDVFELDEDGVAVVYHERGDSEDALSDSLDACPEACIHWQD